MHIWPVVEMRCNPIPTKPFHSTQFTLNGNSPIASLVRSPPLHLSMSHIDAMLCWAHTTPNRTKLISILIWSLAAFFCVVFFSGNSLCVSRYTMMCGNNENAIMCAVVAALKTNNNKKLIYTMCRGCDLRFSRLSLSRSLRMCAAFCVHF